MEFPSVAEKGSVQWTLDPSPIVFSHQQSCESGENHPDSITEKREALSFLQASNSSIPLTEHGAEQMEPSSLNYSLHIGSSDLLGGLLPQPVSIMRFGSLGVDPSLWTSCRMARDIKKKRKRATSVPKQGPRLSLGGAGSEFGADVREERHRKRLERKYRPREVDKESLPWLLKLSYMNDSNSEGEAIKKTKRYRGAKVGGFDNNASYYVFMAIEDFDGGIHYEAFPVDNWIEFRPVQRFKSLSASQAEEKFQQRNDIFNYFCVMAKKRIGLGKDQSEDDKENAPLRAAAASSELDSTSGDDEFYYGEGDNSNDKSKQTSWRRTSKAKRSSQAAVMMDDGEDGDEVEFMSTSGTSSSEASECDDEEEEESRREEEIENDEKFKKSKRKYVRNTSSSSSPMSLEDERMSQSESQE